MSPARRPLSAFLPRLSLFLLIPVLSSINFMFLPPPPPPPPPSSSSLLPLLLLLFPVLVSPALSPSSPASLPALLAGKFVIAGVERAKAGVPQVAVTFDIDANGILKVGEERQRLKDEREGEERGGERGREEGGGEKRDGEERQRGEKERGEERGRQEGGRRGRRGAGEGGGEERGRQEGGRGGRGRDRRQETGALVPASLHLQPFLCFFFLLTILRSLPWTRSQAPRRTS
eukprot:758630-Hanusia_phi.AAC.1